MILGNRLSNALAGTLSDDIMLSVQLVVEFDAYMNKIACIVSSRVMTGIKPKGKA